MVELQRTNQRLNKEVRDLQSELDRTKQYLQEAQIRFTHILIFLCPHSKIIHSLSNANTDVRNLTEENKILRVNLKEYQKSLDTCQMSNDMYR